MKKIEYLNASLSSYCREKPPLSSKKLYFMHEALKEAQKAFQKGEVPVGAVVVWKGEVMSRGHNLRESLQDPFAHAEIMALRAASQKLKNWRLSQVELFVTLEPCVLCLAACVQARIQHLVYGATDLKGGSLSLGYDFSQSKDLNHRFEVTHFPCLESQILLKTFFKNLRLRKKCVSTGNRCF